MQTHSAGPVSFEGEVSVISPKWNESVVLDPHHLQEFTGGDAALQAHIMQIFLDNAPNYLRVLCSAGNENWRADAHKLKGAARSIGAWRLAVSAERAEALGNPVGDDPRRMQCCRELFERLEETISHIKRILND